MFDDHDDGDEDPGAREERRRLFGYRVSNRLVAAAALGHLRAIGPVRDWLAGPLGVPCADLPETAQPHGPRIKSPCSTCGVYHAASAGCPFRADDGEP